MKWLCIPIILGLILHFWSDRIEYVPSEVAPILVNKWTGEHCVLYTIYAAQDDQYLNEKLRVCRIRSNGKVELP